jgi:hypothetical protein
MKGLVAEGPQAIDAEGERPLIASARQRVPLHRGFDALAEQHCS